MKYNRKKFKQKYSINKLIINLYSYIFERLKIGRFYLNLLLLFIYAILIII